MTASARGEARELLRAGEELVLTDWHAAGEATASPEGSELSRGTAAAAALDRITQIGMAAMDRGAADVVELAVQSLTYLYAEAGAAGAAQATHFVDDRVRAGRIRDVALHAYLLGALAVYQEAFELIRPLVLQRPIPRERRRLWLRDTVTSLARAREFPPRSLIPVFAEYTADHAVFLRRFRGSKEALVTALCQFDFLQCVIAVAETNDIHECYPNFGVYYNERVEPIVTSLVRHGPAHAVVASLSDEKLAEIIRQLDRLAGEEFFSFNGWIGGAWTDPSIEQFLALHVRSGR